MKAEEAEELETFKDDQALLKGHGARVDAVEASEDSPGLRVGQGAAPTRRSAVLWGLAIPLLFLSFVGLSTIFHHTLVQPMHPHDNPSYPPLGDDSRWAELGDPLGVNPDYKPVGKLQSNGTHQFERTTILISLDGVRASYLTEHANLTSHLVGMAEKGIRAEYMESIFPSLTFPNHWAIQTGLYAESHGIVANDFYSPQLNKEFIYTVPKQSWPSDWWGGEPIWETVSKAGMKAANCMFPGPPEMANGARPTYWRAYEQQDWTKKLEILTHWIDMDISKRPNLIMMYLPEVDQSGHHVGPDGQEMLDYLTYVDDFIHALHTELDKRHILDIVNMVVVSDHGMTSTSNERVIYLDTILGEDGWNAIEHKEGWPSAGLRFKEGTNLDLMWARLRQAESEANGGFRVYNHETMPERYHFSHNERIAPIYIIPEVGWVVSSKKEHLDEMKGHYEPLGNHGYDPSHPDMHAIFVAHGPFAEGIKSRQRRQDSQEKLIEGFKNVEIYGLIARLLDIPQDLWAPNNGTGTMWEDLVDWKEL